MKGRLHQQTPEWFHLSQHYSSSRDMVLLHGSLRSDVSEAEKAKSYPEHIIQQPICGADTAHIEGNEDMIVIPGDRSLSSTTKVCV